MLPLPPAVTALSAPGKVLLTGGYLVLDRSYTGTVFALDARIHVIVQQLRRNHRREAASGSAHGRSDTPQAEGNVHGDKEDEGTIVVHSPQFVMRYGSIAYKDARTVEES